MITLNLDGVEYVVSRNFIDRQRNLYVVNELKLEKEEETKLWKMKNWLLNRYIPSDLDMLRKFIKRVAFHLNISLTQLEEVKLLYYLHRDLFGFYKIDTIVRDEDIIGIICDGEKAWGT